MSSMPQDFPKYGIPWLIAEIISEFNQLKYDSIMINWGNSANSSLSIIVIGNINSPDVELEFHYDGIQILTINTYIWYRGATDPVDNNDTVDRIFNLLEQEDVENLTSFLKKHCENKNVTIQYCPKPKS